jgi:nucleotide-binding universal stress UspA family protein
MYDNLIVGVDGRHGGRDAAALAGLLATPGARRHLVFVADAPAHNGAGSEFDLHLDQVDADILSQLMDTERQLAGGDAPTLRMSAPSVAEGLQAAAMQCSADLVVVGASRRHGIPRLTRPDDVAALLRTTTETVAIAPTGYRDRPRELRRIGVAYDGTPESEVALAHAQLLAHECGGEAVTHSEHPGLVALSREVDVLVCGSRRNGPVRRLVLGSTSEYLADHVEVPLIITAPIDSSAVERWHEVGQAAGVSEAP